MDMRYSVLSARYILITFRLAIVRSILETQKHPVCRLTTGGSIAHG
jgi:hypothetical protein